MSLDVGGERLDSGTESERVLSASHRRPKAARHEEDLVVCLHSFSVSMCP